MSNELKGLYGAIVPTPEMAVQAVDTTTPLTYKASERYAIGTAYPKGYTQIGPETPNHTIAFNGPNGKEIGRMDFNSGELVFTGDASQSAQVFIEWCRKTWKEARAKDKADVLQKVIDGLLEESSGELYSDEEKIAILSCIQRVQEMRMSTSQLSADYAQNLARSMIETKEQLAASVFGAIAPEGKSL